MRNRLGMTALFLAGVLAGLGAAGASTADLSAATIVVRQGELAPAETIAPTVLAEEIHARTGLAWQITEEWPVTGPIIVVGSRAGDAAWPRPLPAAIPADGPATTAEGYAIYTDSDGEQPVIWLVGADGPGTLFAVGHLLRTMMWTPGSARLEEPIKTATAPAYPIRGHQLGYRYHSNTYDAWDDAQYEQYIRELALFGSNAIEQIPFQDDRVSPHYSLSRRDMNRRLSEICAKYEVQYWLWVPADDLTDESVYANHLTEHTELFDDCPRIDALFFPGGDPGNNPPDLVMPYLEDLAALLLARHPDARIWVSLQGFNEEDAEFVQAYIDAHEPAWLGGLVAGPGSPPIKETRARLHPDYGLRHYPDITHTVRAQYPTPWWDPAFNVTYGREPTNPEPLRYAHIHNWFAPYTVGSISYSDGVNDDINKVVWSRRGWDPDEPVRDILLGYTRLFFGGEVAEAAADGTLGLESNWRGPMAENGAIDAVAALWRSLDAEAPYLADNWRWMLCQMRAEYDEYTRHRFFYEQALEAEANALLLAHAESDPLAAIEAAWAVLERGETERIRTAQHDRIFELGDALFETIGMQTSVDRHQSSGTQRGCVLDLIHYPLFNRWWLEDQFAEIVALDDPAEMTARLLTLARWEHPGPGSFYDDIGNVANSPRRLVVESIETDPELHRMGNAGFMWWDGGYSRTRPSWQSYQSRSPGLRYEGLDPEATYMLRATGMGEPIVMANGEVLTRIEGGRAEIGEFMHFAVPPAAYSDGVLILSWDRPDERHLNWRQHSRLTEVWLLRE